MASSDSTRRVRTTPSQFASLAFDVLVVGGGTAGLALASRLATEGRQPGSDAYAPLLVGVLEAGADASTLPAQLRDGIDVPGLFGSTLGQREVDWGFETEPQAGMTAAAAAGGEGGGRVLGWPRGKVLGGTSALNFMTWNRPAREDLDGWERELGNEGWGWNDMLPFYMKSECFHEPSKEVQQVNKIFYDPGVLGRDGPIHIGYTKEYTASHKLWHDTLNGLGVETNQSHMSGSNVGVWTNVCSVTPDQSTRSYSAACLSPSDSRASNLVILTEALVEEVILEREENELVATGVRFVCNGKEFSASAKYEVILCAGSVKSPQLLELSGIGSPDVLAKAGIAVKIANPNVGENLQDHMMTITVFEVDPSLTNPDDLKTDAALAAAARAEYDAHRTGPLGVLACSLSYLPLRRVVPASVLDDMAAASKPSPPTTADDDPRDAVLHARFVDRDAQNLGQVEYIFDLGNWSASFPLPPTPPDDDTRQQQGEAGRERKKYGTLLTILQYPFSRGSIHVRPAPTLGDDGASTPSKPSAADAPRIDPRYFSGPLGRLDLDALAHATRWGADVLCRAPPLAAIIRRRAWPPEDDDAELPGPEAASSPSDSRVAAAWRGRILRCDLAATDWHPVGTCAMLPAGRPGGVVDARLRVHGVKRGLRVADASVFPLQISGHLQATVYAVAEKAASLVMEDLAALSR